MWHASQFLAWRAAEGLASAECGHYQGQTQTADGGLCVNAETLHTRGETTEAPAAREHDILFEFCFALTDDNG